MNDQFSQELYQSVDEAIAFIDGKGPMTVHRFALPRDLREKAGIAQEEMASLTGMNLPDYQEWESRPQRLHGAIGFLLQTLDKEPDGIKRTLLAAS